MIIDVKSYFINKFIKRIYKNSTRYSKKKNYVLHSLNYICTIKSTIISCSFLKTFFEFSIMYNIFHNPMFITHFPCKVQKFLQKMSLLERVLTICFKH